MRSNRRRHSTFRSVDTRVVAYGAVFIAICTCGAIVNLSLRSRIGNLSKDILKLEREQRAIVDDIHREEAHWAEIVTQRALEMALQRNGLHMEMPTGERIVKLRESDIKGHVDSGADVYTANR